MFGLVSGIGAIFSFLGGIAPAISSYLTARSDNSTRTVESAMAADTAQYQASSSAKVAHGASIAAQIMTLAFGLPTAVHWGWTMLTATFPQWGLHTDPLFGQYAQGEHDIAMSFFILAPATVVLSRILR